MCISKHRLLARWVCAIFAPLLILLVVGCEPKPSVTKTAAPTPSDVGSVAIFTPSNGITLSDHTPLNTWAKLVPEITAALDKQGFDSDRVSSTSSGTLAEQGQKIQDFVDTTIADSTSGSSQKTRTEALSHTTLIVAPVTEPDAETRQYGDYVDGVLASESPASASSGSRPGAASSPSADSDVARLLSALQQAKHQGMHVILISHAVPSFTPDVFVSMTTAEQIGRLQAQELVSKLAVAKATTENPKAIEVILPSDTTDEQDSEDVNAADATFAQDAFKGIWSVLGPYFRRGLLTSPSGLLNAKSTQSSWPSLTIPVAGSSQGDAGAEIAKRLSMPANTSTHTPIDGIIAMNDMAASQVIDELDKLGYTGSSADINPTISIQGIVNNMTGRHDIAKSPVPEPAKEPTSERPTDKSSAGTSDQSTDGQDGSGNEKDSVDAMNARWPIVTGYGAYIDNIPQLVDGKQWMSALENRKLLANDMAGIAAMLNRGQSLNSLTAVQRSDINGVSVPTLSEPLIAVSAGNLKYSLIDPGYVTLAQAGL